MTTPTLDAPAARAGEPLRRFYRVKEAAAVLGVPIRTLYHLAETGQVPCRRLGNVIVLPVDWVEREPTVPNRRR